MKRGRFSEEQIVGILKEHEAGRKIAELAREHGVSEATLYGWAIVDAFTREWCLTLEVDTSLSSQRVTRALGQAVEQRGRKGEHAGRQQTRKSLHRNAGPTRSAETARALIRKTKRATRRRFPTEDKIRIVMEGIRGRCRWQKRGQGLFQPRSILSISGMCRHFRAFVGSRDCSVNSGRSWLACVEF
jgi:transposase-like protein